MGWGSRETTWTPPKVDRAAELPTAEVARSTPRRGWFANVDANGKTPSSQLVRRVPALLPAKFGLRRSPQSYLRSGKSPALIAATKEFILRAAPWDIFLALTFQYDVVEASAHSRFLTYMHAVAKWPGDHAIVAWCWGPQPISGRIHFHALLRSLEGYPRLTPEHIEPINWPGDVDVERVESDDAVSEYLAKHDFTETNVACSRRARCRHSGGCKVAGRRWQRPAELSRMK